MKRLINILKNINPSQIDNNSLFIKLSGDASDRKFYRIKLDSMDSFVLMINPEPFDKNKFSYLIQYDLFSELKMPVAKIYYVDEERGWILMDDLGDTTLQLHLANCNKDEFKQLYRQAIELLFKFHKIDTRLIIKHNKAFRLVFDTQKLFNELLFFFEHFFKNMLNFSIDYNGEKILKKGFYFLANFLANRRRIMVHRDYHSRNIMVKNGELYLIDFQDARMGPRTYDLVSLIRDSYIDIGDELRNELIKFFELEVGAINRKELIYMSLQRNLKAIGTFAYQYSVMKRDLYIEFIPRTINYIIENLYLLDDMDEFRLILRDYIEEAGERINKLITGRRNKR